MRQAIPNPLDAGRRARLESFLASEVRTRFDGRILPVDSAIAERWGLLAAKMEKSHTLPVIDGLFAATAQHHNLTLVTRNTRAVASTGVQLFNPWAY